MEQVYEQVLFGAAGENQRKRETTSRQTSLEKICTVPMNILFL